MSTILTTDKPILFQVGEVYGTHGAILALEAAHGTCGRGYDAVSHGLSSGAKHALNQLLIRHVTDDRSELSPEDSEADRFTDSEGGRVFSTYDLPCPGSNAMLKDRVCIVTEVDQEQTTVLLSDECWV